MTGRRDRGAVRRDYHSLNAPFDVGMARVTNGPQRPYALMEQPTPKERYHVVCRECQLERLFNVADDASRLEREHASETGHRVAVGRIR